MANDEKLKLINEAKELLADIALNRSGLTSEHTVRAMEFVAKATRVTSDVPAALQHAA